VRRCVSCSIGSQSTGVSLVEDPQAVNFFDLQTALLKDCTAWYVPEFHQAEIRIMKAHGGLFGWGSDSTRFLQGVGLGKCWRSKCWLGMEVSMENPWIEKLAIQELCSRYCQTIDAQDSDGWARCFEADGAFEFDGHVVHGYAALREYADAHTRVMRGRHMTLNHLYDLQGDRATGRATTVVSIATPGGYKIMGQGVYEDDLVKMDGGMEDSPSAGQKRLFGVRPGETGQPRRP